MTSSPAAIQKTLETITTGVALRHVEVHDRSAPIIEDGTILKTWDKDGLLYAIEGGVALNHVDTNDRSTPKIEEGASVHPSPLPGLLTEVKAAANHRQAVHEIKEVLSHQGSFPLHHVEAVHDRSSPVIPQDAHVGQWDKPKFLQEVQSPHHLKHVEAMQDRSAPATEGAHVGFNKHAELMTQISAGAVAEQLHHVNLAEVHDASAPVLPKSPSLKLGS